MLTRAICGACLALISYSFLPTQETKTANSLSDEVTAVQADLAQVVDELSASEKLLSLASALQDLQYQQNDMMTALDGISAQLKRTGTVKYVTKSDLDEAIATAKNAVVATKAATSDGCDCQCQSKLTELEARIAALEAKCSVTTGAQYSTKSGGSTGSLSSSSSTYSTTYSTQSAPTVTYSTRSGGSTGNTGNAITSYSQPASSPVAIEMPNETRTVRVVEPRTRRQVSFAEVPENAPLSFAVQSPSTQPSTQQCYIDSNGNQVCSQSVASPSQSVRATPRRTLGSRLFGR